MNSCEIVSKEMASCDEILKRDIINILDKK